MYRVFDAVRQEAERYGVTVLESEIIGLTPQAALVASAEHYLQLARFSSTQILENRLRDS
jgi:glutamate formiminotransferase